MEFGYWDLVRIGLEKELIIISLVSIIEKRLFVDIRKDWVKFVSYYISLVDKKDKFLSFYKFLFN